VLRFLRWSLLSVLFLAVVAFGGTEPISFSVVQVLVFCIAILWSVSLKNAKAANGRIPLGLPGLLLCFLLLQITRLPSWLVGGFKGALHPGASSGYGTLSISFYETRAFFLLVLTYVIVFYLSIVLFDGCGKRKQLVYALLGLATVEAFYGLVQYFTGWRYIFTPPRPYAMASGTFVNPNNYAGLLGMTVPFALGCFFYQFEEFRRELKERYEQTVGGLQQSAFWLFLAIVLFAAIFFSRSRMGILATTLAVGLVFVLGILKARERARLLLWGITFILTSVVFVVWLGVSPVLTRFETLGREYSAQGTGRLDIWKDTLQLVQQNFWLGSGGGTFPIAYTGVQTSFLDRVVNHAHNDYLEVVSELGVPAALLFFGTVVFLAGRLVAHFDRVPGFDKAVVLGVVGSLSAYLAHSLADFNTYIPANGMLLAMVLGMGYAVLHPRPGSERWK